MIARYFVFHKPYAQAALTYIRRMVRFGLWIACGLLVFVATLGTSVALLEKTKKKQRKNKGVGSLFLRTWLDRAAFGLPPAHEGIRPPRNSVLWLRRPDRQAVVGHPAFSGTVRILVSRGAVATQTAAKGTVPFLLETEGCRNGLLFSRRWLANGIEEGTKGVGSLLSRGWLDRSVFGLPLRPQWTSPRRTRSMTCRRSGVARASHQVLLLSRRAQKDAVCRAATRRDLGVPVQPPAHRSTTRADGTIRAGV